MAANWECSRFTGNNLKLGIITASSLSLKSISEDYFNIKVDYNALFSDLKGFRVQVNFSHASDGAMKPKTYDNYVIHNSIFIIR